MNESLNSDFPDLVLYLLLFPHPTRPVPKRRRWCDGV